MRVAWRLLLLQAIALIALSGCSGGIDNGEPALEPIGLYTSLPIMWREEGEISGFLDADAPRHWVLDVLGEHGTVRPIDDLAGADGKLPLSRQALLVLAQPRPLSPGENVALDDWVRSGGRVLLFADPMLTAGSSYSLGDNRRPQDVALLSPILSRWGLELQFDDAQPAGEHMENVKGQAVPVNMAGRFSLAPDSRGCAILGAGLAVHCRTGAGQVLAVADASLLEEGQPGAVPVRQAALEMLIATLSTRD